MKDFLKFIEKTPTAFHAAKEIKNILLENGFVELNESKDFEIVSGGKYFVGRNMSSIIAFTVPEDIKSFNITAAHLDSPTFKLKPNYEVVRGKYYKLNTEVYGGPIYNTWMDRPLGLAGRVIIAEDNQIRAKLININKPILMIPNLPIHYNHGVNKGVELNPQIDLQPIFSDNGKSHLKEYIAEYMGCSKDDIVGSDLYLQVLDRGCLVGPNEEFVMAPQIDNLECSYGLIKALISSNNEHSVNVCALFDNEEIGSSTRQGAASTFLADVLERVVISLGKTKEDYYKLLANSFIISADNAQGYHPNYPQKYDETNACYLNGGIVIKNAARGSYSTDAMSSAYFQMICKKSGVKYQLNTNRSDILGGSTLGAISLRQVSIPSVDIGLAQLAMHSAYETAGSEDLSSLVKAIVEFYSNTISINTEENINF